MFHGIENGNMNEHDNLDKMICKVRQRQLIGASLSEPHTSVYSGTIGLCVRLYVHHTAHVLMLQISDNTSHVELTCVFALALDFDRTILDG